MPLEDRKVNLFIVGAMKSATSSLYMHLKEHPDVYMCEPKEPNFFIHDELSKFLNGSHAKKIDLISDMPSYRNIFHPAKNHIIIGEASVTYLYFYTSAKKIFNYNPDAKVIIIVRNPIERAFSAYNHLKREGDEKLSFIDAINAEELRINQNYPPIYHYKKVGMYFEQISKYLEIFGNKNVLILDYIQYKNNTLDQYREICDFLNIESKYVPKNLNIHFNKSGEARSGLVLFTKFFFSKGIRKIITKIIPFSYSFKQKVIALVSSMLFKKNVEPMNLECLKFYFDKDWENTKKLILQNRNSRNIKI